jgi:hypothetical protein
MTVSTIEAPLITKNELNGFIYKLKNELNVNPINDGYVIPSSISTYIGSLNTIINWDTFLYQTGSGSLSNPPWVQLSFPKRYFFPTAYSMRGIYEENYGRIFATSWNVYGIREGDESDESKWDLLATNTSSESTYCNTRYSTYYCRDKRVGTFTLPNVSTKGYRYMRWRGKTSCCDPSYYFATSGLDVYGTFSTSQTLPTKINIKPYSCYYNCAIHSIEISAFLINLLNKG